jgi:hypothetical protein
VLVQEAKEREWRAKEKAAAERQAAMMADLAAAREAQMRSKLVAQATMAQVEQTEFMRVLTVNQEKEEQQRSQVRRWGEAVLPPQQAWLCRSILDKACLGREAAEQQFDVARLLYILRPASTCMHWL